ncbi:MAG: hypothetical protein KQH67_02660 [Bacteroidetes bacterium]|nr:hypothetical protein [Bacteroidota bacterium]
MKALHTTKTIIATLAVLFAINLNAGTHTLAEENYIHDIPFNTNEIYNEILISSGVLDFDFNEEAYINDIPFNTECITVDCLYEKAVVVTFEMEEESYIDDIPFDTECITAECLYKKALEQNFGFEEESYIDDIPFETAKMIKSAESTQFAMSK